MSGAAVFCGAGIVTSIVYVGASLRHRKQRYMVGEVNMGTAVTDAGLEHLQGRTKVRELYLHRTQVTDAGLAHLQGLTRLVTLDLSRTKITDAGLEPLIPFRKCCKVKPQIDLESYKERNVIERFIGRLKENRRIATRYDKKAAHFAAFIVLAAIKAWLKLIC